MGANMSTCGECTHFDEALDDSCRLAKQCHGADHHACDDYIAKSPWGYRMVIATRGVLNPPGGGKMPLEQRVFQAVKEASDGGWEILGILPTSDGAAIYLRKQRA